jgi:hypothetical protein
MEEIEAGEKALEWENKVTRAQSNSSQMTARAALNVLNEAVVNLRRSTRKLQHIKKDDYHRGIRNKGVGWMDIDTVKALSRKWFCKRLKPSCNVPRWNLRSPRNF